MSVQYALQFNFKYFKLFRDDTTLDLSATKITEYSNSAGVPDILKKLPFRLKIFLLEFSPERKSLIHLYTKFSAVSYQKRIFLPST